MANIDLTQTYKDRTYRQPKFRPVALAENIRVIDFAEAARKKGSALAQNDTIDILPIPINTYVYDVFAIIKTASTAAGTVQIGDSSSATGFITSISTNSTALTSVPESGSYIYSTSAATSPKVYSAANAVRVTISGATAPADGIIELHILTNDTTLSVNE